MCRELEPFSQFPTVRDFPIGGNIAYYRYSGACVPFAHFPFDRRRDDDNCCATRHHITEQVSNERLEKPSTHTHLGRRQRRQWQFVRLKYKWLAVDCCRDVTCWQCR